MLLLLFLLLLLLVMLLLLLLLLLFLLLLLLLLLLPEPIRGGCHPRYNAAQFAPALRLVIGPLGVAPLLPGSPYLAFRADHDDSVEHSRTEQSKAEQLSSASSFSPPSFSPSLLLLS